MLTAAGSVLGNEKVVDKLLVFVLTKFTVRFCNSTSMAALLMFTPMVELRLLTNVHVPFEKDDPRQLTVFEQPLVQEVMFV